MNLNDLGRLIIAAGLALVLAGGLLLLAARVPLLRQIGNLPGDVRIEGKGLACFFPIVSMVVISLLLTLVLNLLLRLFKP